MFKQRKDVLYKGLLALFSGIVLLNVVKTNQARKREISNVNNDVQYDVPSVTLGRATSREMLGGDKVKIGGALGVAAALDNSKKEKKTRSKIK